MQIIRPASLRDDKALEALSLTSGKGMLSLPRDLKGWRQKLSRSQAAFARKEASDDDLFVFVLEDLASGELIGTSQILAKTYGATCGIYLRIENLELEPCPLQENRTISILRPVQHKEWTTEIGGLFLKHAERQKGTSRLLSLSRFLFMSLHPHRFQKKTKAVMRAAFEQNRISPFWNGVGRHFLNIDYDELQKQLASDNSFLPSLIPPFPIYIPLLPPEVQAVIGITHVSTHNALKRLLEEGFRLSGEVDPFDAGPKVEADTAGIRTIKVRRRATVNEIAKEMPVGPLCLVSNDNLDFRACLGEVTSEANQEVKISRQTAQALKIEVGQTVHYVLPKSTGTAP